MNFLSRLFLLLSFISSSNARGQQHVPDQPNHGIFNLEDDLKHGDADALWKLASYFDSESELTEYLGLHVIVGSEADVAKRIVNENCLFLDSEIVITSETSEQEFTMFLEANKDKLIHSDLAGVFVVTPFSARQVRFDIVSLTAYREAQLLEREDELLNSDWVKMSELDELIQERNPEALLKISSMLVKVGRGLSTSEARPDELISLLQLLTRSIIVVPDEKSRMSYHVEDDFDLTSKFNLLCFFAKHYSDYEWDNDQQYFINPNLTYREPLPERELFEQLESRNDSIAMSAYLALTVSDPRNVALLMAEFSHFNMSMNGSLPTFPYRFLKQLKLLTEYCEEYDVDFEGSDDILEYIAQLNEPMTFRKRYALENEITSDLDLDDITAFEYWAIIYGGRFTGQNLTYSAGRILDKFYSENWDDLISDSEHLNLYLKKIDLYDNLGIIGLCNNYHIKFLNSSSATLLALEELKQHDPSIGYQIQRMLYLNKESVSRSVRTTKESDANQDFIIYDPEARFSAILASSLDSSERERELSILLSQISYEQIGKSLVLIENYPFKYSWSKYSFLQRDFGFNMLNFNVDSIRFEFTSNYEQMSMQELYAYYLNQCGISYQTRRDELDYDKIYEILKYDVVTAFVGGGGGKRTNHVYLLIKLLELQFETTLGYPSKLCNSRNIYACSADDRAWEWMKFIEENGLLKEQHNEPVSFSFERE